MKNKLIKNGKYLDHSYVPDILPGREKEIAMLTEHQYDCNIKSRNAVIIGDRGTGKTAVAMNVCLNKIPLMLSEKGERVRGIIVNCKHSNTRFRIYQQMIFQIRGEYSLIRNSEQDARMQFLSEIKDLDVIIIVLDEADMLDKSHIDILYDLSRFQEQGLTDCKVSVVVISNDAYFLRSLDSRTRSSLCQAEFLFKPYNAPALMKILQQRVDMSLVKNSCPEDVLSHIAAIAAQEEGDARYAIWLLAQATEIAGKKGYDSIKLDCIRKARSEVEEQRIKGVIKSLVWQKKLVLMGIITAVKCANGKERPTTGDIYEKYLGYCKEFATVPVTDRRTVDFINDLGNLGIIKSDVVSRGRHGRTHEIMMRAPLDVVRAVIFEDEIKAQARPQKSLAG